MCQANNSLRSTQNRVIDKRSPRLDVGAPVRLAHNKRSKRSVAREELSNSRVIWNFFAKCKHKSKGVGGMIECLTCPIQIRIENQSSLQISLLWEHLRHNHQAEYKQAIKERDEDMNPKLKYSKVYSSYSIRCIFPIILLFLFFSFCITTTKTTRTYMTKGSHIIL